MRKLLYLFAALWIAAAGTVKAAEKEIYATKTVDGGDVIMKLYYDDQRVSRSGVTNWYDWKSEVTKVQLASSMSDARPTSTSMWFYQFSKLKEVSNIEYLNTVNVTTMLSMFEGCSSLISLDLSSFNTANVTDMKYMFSGCTNLKELNLLWFETGKAGGTRCMFENCSLLTTIYCNNRWWNGGALDPSGQFNFGRMFDGCTSLKGGKGTTCNGTDDIDILSAHPDGDNGEPGYFTDKEVPVEAYAALEADGKTMTFYYDGKRKMRGGKTSNWSAWGNVVTKAVFDESFKEVKPTSTENWFQGFYFLETIEHLDYLNTEDVTTMSWMFLFCQKLKSLDLSTFNTAKVTDMSSMFSNCASLQSLDLSSFNTEKVTNMSWMFGVTTDLETLDISTFNTANVTDMSSMFESTGLKKIDLHSFNTEKVTKMENMFAASAVDTLNLNSFSTKVLDNTKGMFSGCTALKTIICAQDWSTSGIFTSTDMFKNCTALKGGEGTACDGAGHIDKEYARPDEEGTPGYFTMPPKEMYAVLESDGTTMTLYYDAERETRGGVTKWDDYYTNEALRNAVTKVVFDDSFKDAKPTSTKEWFSDYKVLESIEHLDYLNTEEVTSMNNMFSSCEKLASLDVSHFITANVTDMEAMFYNCPKLKSIDVSHFNTNNVTNMGFMFCYCNELTSLDLSSFNTEKVTDMYGMFQGCSLTSLDLSSFNTENVTTMRRMFYYCMPLEEIIFDGDWSKSGNVTDSEEMFTCCNKLVGGKGTKYDAEHVDVTYARTDGVNDQPGYFTKPSEMYAVLESDGKTMTLYYDTERETRGGVKDWTEDGVSGYNEVVTKVVFDESIKKAKPKSTYNWFREFAKLESIEHLEYLNTEEVTNMGWMFYGCQALTSIDVSHFNTDKVVSMLRMFENCSALKRLDIRNFNTEEVTNMCGMFVDCKALASIDLSHFDTKKVDDMAQMFNGCSSLTMLNVNSFNVENVTDMSSMFQGCTALERIFCDGDWSPTGAGVDMFDGCAKLVGGNGTKFDAEHTDETYAVTDGLNDKKGYFTSASEIYAVRFFDKEGNLLSIQWVLKGEDAVAPAEGDLPKVEHYHFTGWDKAFDNVGEDLNITAQYALDTYTVKFYDVDNHVYSTQTVEYGKAAVAPELPEVEGYHFVGWEDAFDNVTEDLKIYPIYEINKYTVKFFDKDDNQIGETQTVNWNEAAVAPSDPVWEGHTFTGWSAEFDHVKSDLNIKPIYDVQAYSVTFLGFNDVELKKENVEYGKSATAPSAPEVTGYTFKNWDKDFSNITGDLTVKAVYEINKYTVTFIDWNGTELKKETVEYGKAATAPTDPTREGYTFKGWDKAFDNITADLTVTAQYEEATVYFTVTYYDWDLTILGTEKVAEGKDAKGLDPEPTREGYDFTGWSKPLTNITADLNVMAQYEVKKVYYTVTYYDWDLTILGTEKVEEGKDAKGLDPAPTREGYTFTGWSKPLTNITADINVMAQYEQNPETGIDEVESQKSKVESQKVLINGTLYILRGNEMYSVDGRLVK